MTWKPPATIGVYQIRCKRNGWRYFGGAERSIENRHSVHFSKLNAGLHTRRLQEDYDKYGPKAFVTEVLVECRKSDVRKIEQEYLDKYFGKKCYNVHPKANSPLGCKFDPAGHERRSAKATARCTAEWRAAVSARVKAQHAAGNFGHATWLEENKEATYAKIGAALKGRTGSNHPCYGRKNTPEQLYRYCAAARLREQKRRDGTLEPYIGERHWAYGTTWSAETRATIAATKAATKAAKHEEHLSDYFGGPRASKQSLESFLTKGPKHVLSSSR